MAKLIDVAALADRLQVNPNTIYRWLHRYDDTQIPHFKIGHLVRFDTDEIAAWLEGQHRTGCVRDEADDVRPALQRSA